MSDPTLSASDNPTFNDLPADSWKPSGADSLPAETPAADAPAASSPESATETPVETPREGEGTGQQTGPIPFDRHKTILEAERTKYSDLNTRYESVKWAESLRQQGFTQEAVQQTLQLKAYADHDPIGFLERYVQGAQNDPRLAPQVRALLSRIAGAQQQAAEQDIEPQPDYQAPDGAPIFSAQQLRKWQAWKDRKSDDALSKRVGPLEQLVQRVQQSEAIREIEDRETAAATSLFAEMQTWPHAKEQMPKILAYLNATAKPGPAGAIWTKTPHEAYIKVLTTDVFPTLSQTAQAQAVADLQKSAAASGIRPKSATTSTSKTYGKFTDLPHSDWKGL